MNYTLYAKLLNGKVVELRSSEVNQPDCIEVTGQGVQIGDEHDGVAFKEREPETFHFMRAMGMVLKDNKDTLIIRPEALAIFQKIKQTI